LHAQHVREIADIMTNSNNINTTNNNTSSNGSAINGDLEVSKAKEVIEDMLNEERESTTNYLFENTTAGEFETNDSGLYTAGGVELLSNTDMEEVSPKDRPHGNSVLITNHMVANMNTVEALKSKHKEETEKLHNKLREKMKIKRTHFDEIMQSTMMTLNHKLELVRHRYRYILLYICIIDYVILISNITMCFVCMCMYVYIG
jgi:polyhydroxyalkanoate synthesis regulator phasin